MASPSTTTLHFTLSPQATQKVHEALVCLSKFSEFISLEARREKLCFSALNSTKSAYGAVHLTANKFFESYRYLPSQRDSQTSVSVSQGGTEDARFSCRLQAKALLTVFRQRYLNAKDKTTNIDRCEFKVNDDPSRPECRILVRLVYTHGVLKTYKLTYEEADAMHAIFDRTQAHNKWTIASSQLKGYMEHFGPKAEQLDISSENGRAAFTSFTEKLIDGKEILKQPLQTSVALDTTDFEDFAVDEGTHVAIALKDFRAITLHADTLSEPIRAHYSTPGRALQMHYGRDGLYCEFTLMTTPDTRGTQQSRAVVASAAPAPSRATTRQPSAAPLDQKLPRSSISKPPFPDEHENQGIYTDLPPPPIPSLHHITPPPRPISNNTPPPPRPPPSYQSSTHTSLAAPPTRPPSPPLPARKDADKPLFLSYQSSSSSEDEDDDLARGLEDIHDLVGWDTIGRAMGVVVAKDAEPEEGALRGGRSRTRRGRKVVEDEEEGGVKDGEKGEEAGVGTGVSEGVGPTQQSLVKGLFD